MVLRTSSLTEFILFDVVGHTVEDAGFIFNLIIIIINGQANADSKVVSHGDQVSRDQYQLSDLGLFSPLSLRFSLTMARFPLCILIGWHRKSKFPLRPC